MSLLSWIAPSGSRGIVTWDLLSCIMDSVCSVPSPNHHCAKEDIRTVAAHTQIAKAPFMDLLCPLQAIQRWCREPTSCRKCKPASPLGWHHLFSNKFHQNHSHNDNWLCQPQFKALARYLVHRHSLHTIVERASYSHKLVLHSDRFFYLII
ncbi:hypothetical protein JVT61DRAFT_14210 [Boletus reticuloceps]|uniref:Uncharacterized protein n=1 Tax=Boletus reticuloceps TaxID=495285 RepID=A0A8I2YD02_9AGAM|nr:hypothetical protein JVT61DRAFT_14210 [Boletus reticuloceps]